MEGGKKKAVESVVLIFCELGWMEGRKEGRRMEGERMDGCTRRY